MKKKMEAICPYCFTKLVKSKVFFKCCKETFPSKSISKMKGNCKSCKKTTTTRICGHCTAELPYTFGLQKEVVISVIGAKEAGKSHYIGVLLNKIMNEMGMAFHCALQPLSDETIRRYREDFHNPLFKNKETLQVTMSARSDKKVQRPLLYNLSFFGKNIFGKKVIKSVITLAFFDTAGEDMNDEDTMATVNKYIYNSSGIIFLLDPLQITEVRERLEGKIPLPYQNSEVEDLLSRTANLIKKGRDILPNQLINIPVAVSFSKMDALDDIIDGSSIVKNNSPHIESQAINKQDFEDVHHQMQNYITRFGGGHFISQINANFINYSCFGISALGSNPKDAKITNTLQPRRVEDPFLWLLWKNKIIS
ncbi:TRAFAC clade GTPase domain-containing protein [Lottiidibacillus patelloidae]|nr:hypothetical protein [Lottiidibacillus patelloidae]